MAVWCPHPCQVTVSEQGQNVLSTLSFVGPSRDGTNKLSPGDRGHYSCQFENQVLCVSSEFHSAYFYVQCTILTCLLILFCHGAELSFGTVNKCHQHCTYWAVFPPCSNLKSAFLCAISKHYVQKYKYQNLWQLLLSQKTIFSKKYFTFRKVFRWQTDLT